MKGMVGIGEDRMEEGEVRSITQHRQIERRRRTQAPERRCRTNEGERERDWIFCFYHFIETK